MLFQAPLQEKNIKIFNNYNNISLGSGQACRMSWTLDYYLKIQILEIHLASLACLL